VAGDRRSARAAQPRAGVGPAAALAPQAPLFAVVRERRLPIERVALPFVPKRYRR